MTNDTNVVLVSLVVITLLVLLLWLSFRPRQFLRPDTFKEAKLIEKETVTHNTNRYRFELPRGSTLGLPTGQHISFKFVDDGGKEVMRSYTPVTGDDTVGYVDFVIKVYPEGKMSQHVDKLSINDSILMRGPKGKFKYSRNMKRKIGALPPPAAAGDCTFELLMPLHYQREHLRGTLSSSIARTNTIAPPTSGVAGPRPQPFGIGGAAGLASGYILPVCIAAVAYAAWWPRKPL